MAEDDITMTPEYEFEFENNETRNTSEIDDGEKYPKAIETLAMLGREDPECEVTMVGMAN